MDDVEISNTGALSSAQYRNNEPEGMVASPDAVENPKKNAKQQHGGSGDEHKSRPPQEEPLNCPRCNSKKTKFCYFNNRNRLQPRHYCKACRRYWTQGGSLRDVPVGGSCRKNRRSSSAATLGHSSKVINNNPQHLLLPGGGHQPMMVPAAGGSPPAMMDFPNVLPTFMSTGGSLDIPGEDYHHNHLTKLPFLPLSLSTPSPMLAPGFGMTTAISSFLDALREGHIDDNNDNHECNNLYSPIGGGEMALPPFGGGIDDTMDNTNAQQDLNMQKVDVGKEGGGGMVGWLSQHGNNNHSGLQVVGDDGAHHQQQQGCNSSSTNTRDSFYNWTKGNNNGGGGRGGLMNLRDSLI